MGCATAVLEIDRVNERAWYLGRESLKTQPDVLAELSKVDGMISLLQIAERSRAAWARPRSS